MMKYPKSIFVTSDWHIGHAKSIEYDNRPFRSLDDMHESLIRRYNSTVPADGLCYFLGDIGIYKTEKVKEVLSQLNGTKVCIVGNHDKNMYAMYNVGFDVVLNHATVQLAQELVTMTHCPLRGTFRENFPNNTKNENWHGETRDHYNQFAIDDHGGFHLHGHIHSRPNEPNRSKKILHRQYDVGVVANNYTPVSFDSIAAWIQRTKANGG